MSEDEEFALDHIVWESTGRYEHTVTIACFKGGSGSCDGYSEAGVECECPCHKAPITTPEGVEARTAAEYQAAHQHLWATRELRSAHGVVPLPTN